MQTALESRVGILQAWSDVGELEEFHEERFRFRRVVEIVAGSRECADQERVAFAVPVFDGRHVPIGVLPNSLTVRRIVFLQKIAAIDAMSIDG